jgi:hypothetical protein
MSTALTSQAAHRTARDPTSAGRISAQQPLRRQDWNGRSPQEILAGYRPGKAGPLKVLEVLLELFNTKHTSRQKTVSHKTRQDRADFLRRFYAALHDRAGFKTGPTRATWGRSTSAPWCRCGATTS